MKERYEQLRRGNTGYPIDDTLVEAQKNLIVGFARQFVPGRMTTHAGTQREYGFSLSWPVHPVYYTVTTQGYRLE